MVSVHEAPEKRQCVRGGGGGDGGRQCMRGGGGRGWRSAVYAWGGAGMEGEGLVSPASGK